MAHNAKLSVDTRVPGGEPRRSPRLKDKSPGALEPPSAKPSKSKSKPNSKAVTPVNAEVNVIEATPVAQNDLGNEASAKGSQSRSAESGSAAGEVSEDGKESGSDIKSSKKGTKGQRVKVPASQKRSSKEGKRSSVAKARKHISAVSDEGLDTDHNVDDVNDRASESSGDSESAASPDQGATSFDDDDDDEGDTSEEWVTGRDLLTNTGKPYENTILTMGRGPARLRQKRAVDIDADAMENVTVEYPHVIWYDEANDEEIVFEIMNVRERSGSATKRPPRTVVYDVTPSAAAAGRYEGSLPEIYESYAASTALLPVSEELDTFNEEDKTLENKWWLSLEEFSAFYGDIHFVTNESPVSCLWVTFYQNGMVEYAGFRVKIPVYDGKKATGSYDEYKIEGPAGWIKHLIPKQLFDLAVERYKLKVMRTPREWKDAVKPIRDILRGGTWGQSQTKRTTLETIEWEFSKKEKGKKEELLRDVREATFASPPPKDVGRRRRGETPKEQRGALRATIEASKERPRAQSSVSRANRTAPKTPVRRDQRATGKSLPASGSTSTHGARGTRPPRQSGHRRSPPTAGPSDRATPSRRS